MVRALAREAYEPDKEITDVEEPPFRPAFVEVDVEALRDLALPRVATEELTMHVQIDDGWHRMASDGLETACGLVIDIRLQIDTRPGRLIEHPLATCECWTTRERVKANDAFRAKWGAEFQDWKTK